MEEIELEWLPLDENDDPQPEKITSQIETQPEISTETVETPVEPEPIAIEPYSNVVELEFSPLEEEVTTTTAVTPEIIDNVIDLGKPNRILNGSNINLDKLIGDFNKELGRGFIKEDIMDDPKLMEIVYRSLDSRRGTSSGILGKAYGAAAYSAGADRLGQDLTYGAKASGPRSYRNMPKEKAFEIWQNYQRSFSAGQSITTVNEIAFGISANDEVRRDLGAGYLLFDAMDNAFTGEGSWREMGDAIWDYGRNTVWDPTTALSFGIAKILGLPAAKASSLASQKLMVNAYRAHLAGGMAKDQARKMISRQYVKMVGKEAMPVVAAEALFNVGLDIAYQSQLLKTGAQEEFSYAQTALTAAGAIIMPALVFGTKEGVSYLRKNTWLKDTFAGGVRVDARFLTLNAEDSIEELGRRVDKDSLISGMSESFGKIEGDTQDFLAWEEILANARGERVKLKQDMNDEEIRNAFFTRLFFGSPDEKKMGLYQALHEAGFEITPSMKEKHRISGSYAEGIKLLDDTVLNKIVKEFEDSTGLKLNLPKTAEEIGNVYAMRSSIAGQTLWLPSQLSRLNKMSGLDAGEVIKKMGRSTDEVGDPKRLQFGLSVYKRLVTAHTATAGANVRGFSTVVAINMAADFVVGATNISQSGFYKYLKKDPEKAEMYFNRAYGSILGSLRKGVSVFSPDLDMDFAKQILEVNPEVAAKIFRDVAGDGGAIDPIGLYNVSGKGYKFADNITKRLQIITMARAQDELTKTWAFGANVNQYIMREYGMKPQEFFHPHKRNWAAVEMASDKFKINVLEKAAHRTMRETASVNWSTLPNKGLQGGLMRSIAEAVEYTTNKTPVGFVVPFGSFLNTTLAMAGDLSGVNSVGWLIRKGMGKDVDYVTREGAEVFAKTIVGFTAVTYMMAGENGAYAKIKEGLSWNQDRNTLNDDGSIRDVTFEWPEGSMRLAAQMLAHAIPEGKTILDADFGEIPEDLWGELGNQLGGQAIRNVKDVDKAFFEWLTNLSDFGESRTLPSEKLESWGVYNETLSESGSIVFGLAEDFIGPALSVIAGGGTRPADPVNQLIGLVTDAEMAPDLRQGPENYNYGIKYVNNLFSSIGLPSSNEQERRINPMTGESRPTDLARQLGAGKRSKEPTLIQAMLNTAGKDQWDAIQFDGPAEIKNYMDALVAPYLEAAAEKYMRRNPNFFVDMNKENREAGIAEVITFARKEVMSVMQSGAVPRSLEMVRVLSGKDSKKISRVMEELEIKGTLEDVLKEEDALGVLSKIQYLLDNYDDIFLNQRGMD